MRAVSGVPRHAQIRIGITTYLKPACSGTVISALRVGVLQLDLDHLLAHVGQRVDQVGDVEADLDGVAAVVDLELFHRLFLLGVGRGDAQGAGLDVDAHALELLAGQDGGALQARQQRRAAERDAVLVVLRDHAVVVGELALDQLVRRLEPLLSETKFVTGLKPR